ncbi:hypothetical protein GLOTRDRAFT_91489 [Gloeophyllum trabeum ATCC 11539]|uniref:Uncharacterized protein n=1 Tax=Gloeophyllum trabeum (strain ATCC 11539 / FP-39264 / Madison 617) TaxID=670483 RepID=S7QER2_GLOTA|nr:uncharacterized protein GLOTRDRAFT_91489 [Gloeophyllum trabeum ATCC 11539]EPQ57922.1 hypothetical protein GLOTRDRAFT_91489 [Gloeophyllum trabeum ATCC 11539]
MPGGYEGGGDVESAQERLLTTGQQAQGRRRGRRIAEEAVTARTGLPRASECQSTAADKKPVDEGKDTSRLGVPGPSNRRTPHAVNSQQKTPAGGTTIRRVIANCGLGGLARVREASKEPYSNGERQDGAKVPSAFSNGSRRRRVDGVPSLVTLTARYRRSRVDDLSHDRPPTEHYSGQRQRMERRRRAPARHQWEAAYLTRLQSAESTLGSVALDDDNSSSTGAGETAWRIQFNPGVACWQGEKSPKAYRARPSVTRLGISERPLRKGNGTYSMRENGKRRAGHFRTSSLNVDDSAQVTVASTGGRERKKCSDSARRTRKEIQRY